MLGTFATSAEFSGFSVGHFVGQDHTTMSDSGIKLRQGRFVETSIAEESVRAFVPQCFGRLSLVFEYLPEEVLPGF